MDTEAIRQARIDLTAILRWADRLGLSEGICNHFSLVVPGTTDRFLINPQGLHWSEMQTSDLLVVDPDGNVVEGKWQVEPTAFFIHSQIHRGNPSAQCVLHTHMPYATALCAIDGGRLEWVSQNALRFYQRIAYEEAYNGLALDEAEGQRLREKLTEGKVAFLANHGVIVTGAGRGNRVRRLILPGAGVHGSGAGPLNRPATQTHLLIRCVVTRVSSLKRHANKPPSIWRRSDEC